MKKLLPIFLAVTVVFTVGALCFYGGIKYDQSKSPSEMEKNGNFDASGFQTGASFGMDGTSQNNLEIANGEITAIDNNSITIKTQNGGTKIISYSELTEITKTETASTDDFKIGETISVSGASSEDGSINAETIQINTLSTNSFNGGQPNMNRSNAN